jgi:hypothetical protein
VLPPTNFSSRNPSNPRNAIPPTCIPPPRPPRWENWARGTARCAFVRRFQPSTKLGFSCMLLLGFICPRARSDTRLGRTCTTTTHPCPSEELPPTPASEEGTPENYHHQSRRELLMRCWQMASLGNAAVDFPVSDPAMLGSKDNLWHFLVLILNPTPKQDDLVFVQRAPPKPHTIHKRRPTTFPPLGCPILPQSRMRVGAVVARFY